MTTARTIISLALESMNRLSPGETLDADLAAACMRRLNSIADDWSAGRDMMPQDRLVSGAVTGATITLGAGAFATLTAGTEVIQLQVDDACPTNMITMQQYQSIGQKNVSGQPRLWVSDGLSTIYLYPAAAGNTVSIMARVPFARFADLDTEYTMPAGYEGAFAASLSVGMAPTLLGGVTASLQQAKREALYNVAASTVKPAIISASPMTGMRGSILQGWN